MLFGFSLGKNRRVNMSIHNNDVWTQLKDVFELLKQLLTFFVRAASLIVCSSACFSNYLLLPESSDMLNVKTIHIVRYMRSTSHAQARLSPAGTFD